MIHHLGYCRECMGEGYVQRMTGTGAGRFGASLTRFDCSSCRKPDEIHVNVAVNIFEYYRTVQNAKRRQETKR